MSATMPKLGDKHSMPLFPAGSETLLAVWKATFADLPMTLASEVTKFASHRLRAQADFLAKLNRSKTYVDVLEAQAAFWQATTQDYRDEAGKLIEDITAAGSEKKAA